MIVIILDKIIIRAKIPNGWEWNEEIKSPIKIYDMEFPKPHPGQNLIPRLAKGQIVKCEFPGEWIKSRNAKPNIQIAASKPISNQIFFSLFSKDFTGLFSLRITVLDKFTFCKYNLIIDLNLENQFSNNNWRLMSGMILSVNDGPI